MEFFTRYRTEAGVLVFVLFALCGYLYVFAAPYDFSPSTVRIVPGTSVTEITRKLADARIIAHTLPLRVLIRLSGANNTLSAGVYKFDTPQNLFIVAYRLLTGETGFAPVRITFVEGITVREMALRIAQALPDVSAEDFLAIAKEKEGYLFPDTYLFPPSADASLIVAMMRSNFDTKIASLENGINASGRSLEDTVILASLVEKEARTSVSRHMVAGILVNRLKLKMPLQVDAVFGYIFNKDTYSPSFADLKVVSPFNTYTHIGLPPRPIDNPGLDSLEAAVNPTKTKYLYYLTGKDNLMHYATTYAGHLANQKKYLQ